MQKDQNKRKKSRNNKLYCINMKTSFKRNLNRGNSRKCSQRQEDGETENKVNETNREKKVNKCRWMLQYSVLAHFCLHYYSAISTKQDTAGTRQAREKRIPPAAKLPVPLQTLQSSLTLTP